MLETFRRFRPTLFFLALLCVSAQVDAQGKNRKQRSDGATESQQTGEDSPYDASEDEELLGSGHVRQPGQVTKDALSEELLCAIGRPPKCEIALAQKYGLRETGLRPQFPPGLECRDIDEGYAISYSGKRSKEQYHGGIDMPAPGGTPIIAVADGTVVGVYEGLESFRGMEIILRHRPEDTGFPYFIYTQYAHFDVLPSFKVGDVVRKGQTLGPTGNSGRGRKGGQSTKRRPAIHFAAWFSPSDKYVALGGKVIPLESRWMDPNALYLPKDHALDTESLKAIPENRKRVPVAVMIKDGTVIPQGARIVWPYHCAAR